MSEPTIRQPRSLAPVDLASLLFLGAVWGGAFLFVTHDRRFLRKLARRILEIDRGRLFDWSCDYDTFLVRKEAKGHGTGSRIEGDLEPGEHVAILEDTVTTGGSARKAIDAVVEAGAVPVVVMAIADREDPDADAFRKEWPVECLLTLSEIKKG